MSLKVKALTYEDILKDMEAFFSKHAFMINENRIGFIPKDLTLFILSLLSVEKEKWDLALKNALVVEGGR